MRDARTALFPNKPPRIPPGLVSVADEDECVIKEGFPIIPAIMLPGSDIVVVAEVDLSAELTAELPMSDASNPAGFVAFVGFAVVEVVLSKPVVLSSPDPSS